MCSPVERQRYFSFTGYGACSGRARLAGWASLYAELALGWSALHGAKSTLWGISASSKRRPYATWCARRCPGNACLPWVTSAYGASDAGTGSCLAVRPRDILANSRTREIGIRIAVGAPRGDVLWLEVRPPGERAAADAVPYRMMPRPKARTVAKTHAGGLNEIAELLKDLLIAQLGIAGVPQQRIRQILGCDMNRVSRIVRHLKSARRKEPT
jgi:hypothetical protein